MAPSVARIVTWVQAFALGIGGPGLFLVAFLDSSFLSLPEINDLLVVMLVIEHKARMPYYALMATLGSLTGCLVLYGIGRRGGEALVRRRFGRRADEARALALEALRRIRHRGAVHPAAAGAVQDLRAPRGVAAVPLWQFAITIALARGFRYFMVGVLSVRYGDDAIAFIEANGRAVSLVLVGLIVAGGLAWIVWRRRRRPETGDL